MAVQGNVPRPGLDFNAERRAVLDNHVAGHPGRRRVGRRRHPAATRPGGLARELLRHRPAAQRRRGRRDQRPPSAPSARRSLVGAVLEGPGEHISNVEPALPARDRASPSATSSSTRCRSPSTSRSAPSSGSFSDKVDLVAPTWPPAQAGGVPGARRRRAARCGRAVICFEVAYDGLMRDTVRGRGASVLVVQTNNATFGYTDESEQQLAISRLRAVEHGRSIVHVSTVGVSALHHPRRNRRHQQTALFTAALLAGHLPLRTAATVADRARRLARVPRRGAVLAGAPRASSPGAAGRVAAATRRTRTAMTHSEQPPLTPRPPRPARPGGRAVPTYNERENLPRIVARLRAAVPQARRAGGRRRLTRRHRRGRRRARPATDPPVHVLHRREQGRGSAPPTSPASAGRWSTATTSLVEMDADGSHQPEQLPALLAALATPTWSSARAGCPAGRSSTGRCTARCSRVGGNIYTRVAARHAARATPPAASASTGAARCRTIGAATTSPRRATASRWTWPGGPSARGLRVRRGADHLRRARARRLQDEPRHRARGAGRASPAGGWPTGPAGPRAAAPGAPVAPAVGTHAGRARRRRPRPAARSGWSCVALLLVPGRRDRLLIAVGQVIGGWPTLAAGAGRVVPRRLRWSSGRVARAWSGAARRRCNTGQMPASELADAALVLVGGVLLLAARLPHRHGRAALPAAVHPPVDPTLAAGRGRAAAARRVPGYPRRGRSELTGPPPGPDARRRVRAVGRRRDGHRWQTDADPARLGGAVRRGVCGLVVEPRGLRRCACGAASRRVTRAGASGAPPGAPPARGWSDARAACPSGCGRA